jgi:hypothetical protein
MRKIIKTRKDRLCDACGENIKKGEFCYFESFRVPRYDKNDKQIGVEYIKTYMHLDTYFCNIVNTEGECLQWGKNN